MIRTSKPKLEKCLRLIACSAVLFSGLDRPPKATAAAAAGKGRRLEARALEIIREGLEGGDPRVTPKAMEIVAATRQMQFLPAVHRLTRDRSVPVRFAAALALGDLEYAQARRPLEKMLDDPDENVRIAAAYALTRLGHEQAFMMLIEAASSGDETVRANGVMLLGKSGRKSAVKTLYGVLHDEKADETIKFQAVEAIAAIGDEKIYPKIWTMLISAYADDRIMGVRAMGLLGTVEARNALLTMLGDDIAEVRLAAAERLGILGSRQGLQVVAEALSAEPQAGTDGERDERILVMAALATGRICESELTDRLGKLLEHPSRFVRIAAAGSVIHCR
jgi:HEAT repeat protein